ILAIGIRVLVANRRAHRIQPTHLEQEPGRSQLAFFASSASALQMLSVSTPTRFAIDSRRACISTGLRLLLFAHAFLFVDFLSLAFFIGIALSVPRLLPTRSS